MDLWPQKNKLEFLNFPTDNHHHNPIYEPVRIGFSPGSVSIIQFFWRLAPPYGKSWTRQCKGQCNDRHTRPPQVQILSFSWIFHVYLNFVLKMIWPKKILSSFLNKMSDRKRRKMAAWCVLKFEKILLFLWNWFEGFIWNWAFELFRRDFVQKKQFSDKRTHLDCVDDIRSCVISVQTKHARWPVLVVGSFDAGGKVEDPRFVDLSGGKVRVFIFIFFSCF